MCVAGNIHCTMDREEHIFLPNFLNGWVLCFPTELFRPRCFCLWSVHHLIPNSMCPFWQTWGEDDKVKWRGGETSASLLAIEPCLMRGSLDSRGPDVAAQSWTRCGGADAAPAVHDHTEICGRHSDFVGQCLNCAPALAGAHLHSARVCVCVLSRP